MSQDFLADTKVEFENVLTLRIETSFPSWMNFPPSLAAFFWKLSP